MRTAFILFILISILSGACISEKTNREDNKIVIGTIDSLYSKILNEQRKIWIYVPEADNTFARKTYPVVYLLDGDAHFYTVMSIIQQLSSVNMNMVLPQMILVGIQNTNRTRDLTPSRDTLEDPSSGGSENFTAFLEKELFPFVDSKYSTAPYRVIIGHSYGGLFCVNTLINHPKLFNSYLAIDPSMNWDNRKLLKQAKEVLAQKNYEGSSFFLSIANQGYSDTDTSKDNAAAFELAKYLDSNAQNNLRYRWHYYKDDNHGSVPLISEYDGLRFMLDYYNPRISYRDFRNPAYNVDSFITVHYARVSSLMGYRVPPPESLLNWLGYLFIMEKQYNKAHDLLKKNVENFPESYNAFDSMGEILIFMGDTAAAVQNFEKSLDLNPRNENARNMIRKYKKQ